MQKVKADFVVETKDGIVTRVGKSSVVIPGTNFGGGSIKWYEDNLKRYFPKGH